LDSRIDKCNICGTEYGHDQIHRRGTDCAGPLAAQIDKTNRAVSDLVNMVKDVDATLQSLIGRHEKLAIRVTNLERNAKKGQ
jgi:hypothetical protein